MYKRDLTEILDGWVAGMTFPVNIYTVAIVGGNYSLGIDNLYHAQVGYNITINSVVYTIVSFDDTTCPNKTLVVSGPTEPAAGEFNMYSPVFTHGTIVEVNAETVPSISAFIMPSIYLLEQFKERDERDPESVIERESAIQLFFMCPSDYTQGTDYIYTQYLQPMQRLKDAFVGYMDTFLSQPGQQVYKWEQTDDCKNYYKLGAYINGKGIPKGLFSNKLSAVELDLKLMLYKPDH